MSRTFFENLPKQFKAERATVHISKDHLSLALQVCIEETPAQKCESVRLNETQNGGRILKGVYFTKLRLERKTKRLKEGL